MNIPVNPYPIEALVKVVREAVLEVNLNVQAPLVLCAVSALSTLAAAAQEKIKVTPPWSGPKQAGTYWAVIADSGERKTAVDKLFGKEVAMRDLLRARTYTAALDQYETDHRIWSKGEQALIRRIATREQNSTRADDLRQHLAEHLKHKPSKPRLRRLIRQDMSERAIMDAFEGDGESIALICDEGEILLRSAVLSKPSLLNKTWDGGPFHFDRKDRSIAATDTRSTVSVMVQQAILKEYLDKRGDAVRGSGFWARFLMCWPQSTQGMRYTSYVESTWEKLNAYHARVREILADDTQRVYEFDADAKVELVTLVNQIEMEIRPWTGYLSDINDFASKAGENTARIAALLHHAGQQPGMITLDTTRRAWALVKWHLEEAKRIFAPRTEVSQVQLDAQSVEAYLRTHMVIPKDGNPPYAPRNAVLHCGPVRPVARLKSALDYLTWQEKVVVWQDAKRKWFISPGLAWGCF